MTPNTLTPEDRKRLGDLADFMRGQSFLISPTTIKALLNTLDALEQSLAETKAAYELSYELGGQWRARASTAEEEVGRLRNAVGDGTYQTEYDGQMITQCIACNYDVEGSRHSPGCLFENAEAQDNSEPDAPEVRKYNATSGRVCPLHGCRTLGCQYKASCRDQEPAPHGALQAESSEGGQ